MSDTGASFDLARIHESAGAAAGSASGRASGSYDVLVVGSGIGGMESALKLGDMGYRVLMVEKEASVGGKMVLLSKVFPTLDCASCISTPKMAAAVHHPNVEVLTYSEVEEIARSGDGRFRARIRRKPRFVDESLCTGCRDCEQACTVAVPDEFNEGMIPRRAVHIPFPQAVPLKALIERAGSSPCSFECPAGIKAHGYVSLIRSGEYEKAFQLVLEATPLAGSLGRACYAFCEGECTRGDLEGPVPVRRLKRFVADRHYRLEPEPAIEVPEQNGKAVAVIGSGPAGLTAAWQLARKGYRVKILESALEPGGMLRTAIPGYRLPVEVVERDIANVTALGVEIETGVRAESLEELEKQGFDAVLVATGTPVSTSLGVPGESLSGVADALAFLREVRLGRAPDLTNRRVVVVGGGDVAIDAARSARRLGAKEVAVAYRRGREEMPAHGDEVRQAKQEGIRFELLVAPVEVLGSKNVTGLRCARMRLGEPDASGRRRPEPVPGSETELGCDLVVTAIGMRPEPGCFEQLERNGDGTIAASAETAQTKTPYVFAAGDVVSGPADIATAAGQGRRAAFMIDRWLKGLDPEGAVFDDRLAAVGRAEVLARQKSTSRLDPSISSSVVGAAHADFDELEPPLTEAEAMEAARRCLDCGVCSECGECVSVCPADAINLDMREQELELEVGAVIVSTGFKLFPADLKPEYGYGRYENVITATQMERLLAPTRPYNTLLRPGDGKVPERIAYVMCTGSRDQTVENPLCSKFCCMYSIKQNQLIMGVLPLAELTVHYIDVRAAGKGYDEFYEQASAMGASFVKGKVAEIRETEEGNLVLRYEDFENGGTTETEYDLVVLAVGVQPNRDTQAIFPEGGLAFDEFGFVDEADEDANPALTSLPGVYVAGSASGAKDIPESILHAGAAAAQAAAHLEQLKAKAES
jgi:heterodisulfide reductase subunit A-like polyferredoxin